MYGRELSMLRIREFCQMVSKKVLDYDTECV